MNQMLSFAIAALASRLGRFEKQVLLFVDSAGADAYCAELTRLMTDHLDREVSMGQTSRTLSALKAMGLLSVEQVMPKTPQKNQRSRLVYSLTEDGRRVADALQATTDMPNSARRLMAPAH